MGGSVEAAAGRKGIIKESSASGLPPISVGVELPPIYQHHDSPSSRPQAEHQDIADSDGELLEHPDNELTEAVHLMAEHIELMENLLVKQSAVLNQLVAKMGTMSSRLDEAFDCITAEVHQVGISVDKHLALRLIKNVSKTSGNPCSPLLGAEEGAKLVSAVANKYGFRSDWNTSDPFSVKAQHFLCRNLLLGRR